MADAIYYQLSRYTQLPIIILGSIGGIFNQILFYYRKPLRATSCSLYFRALSVNDFLVLYIYVLFQWLADHYGFDPTLQYNWYCKTKSYLTSSLYTLSPYLIVMACFDRLCTSSRNIRFRHLATIRVASILIPCVTVFVFAAYFFIPIIYKLVPLSTGPLCSIFNPLYSRIFAIYLVIFLGVMPPCLMLILCSFTLMLLRQQRRQIMPINQARYRRRDNQLLKMLFFYVASHLICTIPFSTCLLLAVYELPSPSAATILAFRLSILLFNVNFATSFYIYTLGTPFYRYELCCLIKDIRKKIHRMMHPDHVHQVIQINVNPRPIRT
jgi:hypothetical protein